MKPPALKQKTSGGILAKLVHLFRCNHLWCPWCEKKLCRGDHSECQLFETEVNGPNSKLIPN